MGKFLILTLVILVVGYFCILGLMKLYKTAFLLEDEVHQERLQVKKDLEDLLKETK